MKRSLSLAPLAKKELDEAVDYYDAESPGLGRAFVSEIEDAFEQILDYPESAPIVRGTVRRKILRRFPYDLLYSVRPDSVRILAVMNQKRRPFYWWGRK
ncbi:MAG TPA: type II toxin-antitoxin system RelE/ParE family toxin [Thermoanaerobaculia bacterium]|nr:type II toxin-antitoxin system RelE/ParE family toxin [Thermoanaerobaculia bacterium]